MLGKIKTISKNGAVVEVDTNTTTAKDLINLHVVFEDSEKKILGEIDSILEDTIKITFLGELTENDFIGGLIKKPSLDASIRIINEQELRILTGEEDKGLRLGVSPLYNDFPLNVNIDELFSNHTAIFGNTGSGKTYGICRIIQNIFPNSQTIPYKANLFIFDSYGEYINAFKICCENNNIKLIDVTNKMIESYRKDFKCSYGFPNTAPGEGHLNKTGHRIIAEELYKSINEMEENK